VIYLQRPYIILNKCDNTPGCPVIEACPQDIFHYDYNVKKLLLNDNKCLECSLCVTECDHDAVRMYEPEIIKEKRKQEDQYGMALAERIKDHYNIEPTSIYNDEQITAIKDFEKIKKYKNVLLYVYGNWQAESYIGYSFFKEIIRELEEEIDNFKGFKISYKELDEIEITELPSHLIIKDGKVKNKYSGIKNPMYFVPTLISEY